MLCGPNHKLVSASNCQVGLKVADLQEQSAVNRKQLADTTREFKRSTAAAADNEYVQAVAALLKRYQEEIDALTRRAKHGGLLAQGVQRQSWPTSAGAVADWADVNDSRLCAL
jgi:lipid II:glycine glycyltransferase (peptidoglycan interpeptide bridge formation enzyme)